LYRVVTLDARRIRRLHHLLSFWNDDLASSEGSSESPIDADSVCADVRPARQYAWWRRRRLQSSESVEVALDLRRL